MKQGKIIQAYKALDGIMAQRVTLPVAKSIFDMQRKMQNAWDFQIQEENKIAERHPNVNPREGSVKYDQSNEEDKKEKLAELDSFIRELTELADMDTALEIEPIVIHISMENIKMSGNDIKALNGFVNFEE